MSILALNRIKTALSNLNPDQVRKLADRPLHIAVRTASPESFSTIEAFLLRDLAPERRRESAFFLTRDYGSSDTLFDFTIYDDRVAAPPRALIFRLDRTQEFVRRVLDQHADLSVPLARAFPPFRAAFVQKVISQTCKENALFSLTTALPDVIPSLMELPWAVAEFASDTAFLTMNQLKMAFLIAAASDREVGFREQKSEIATVIAGAFGWRALARQIVGKVPFGGGLVGKAAIAYAGTKVVGLSLDQLYSIGYVYSRDERETLYRDAFQQGKKMAGKILTYVRPDLAAKYVASEKAKQNA
jgi:hypothetical protein